MSKWDASTSVFLRRSGLVKSCSNYLLSRYIKKQTGIFCFIILLSKFAYCYKYKPLKFRLNLQLFTTERLNSSKRRCEKLFKVYFCNFFGNFESVSNLIKKNHFSCFSWKWNNELRNETWTPKFRTVLNYAEKFVGS